MDVFESLPEEKRLAVLNAGYHCFGQNRYKKTSMADIAVEAGVSKASLFHYFGNKQAFYVYLYDYGAKKMLQGLEQGLDTHSDDFFVRLKDTHLPKMHLGTRYPDMCDFYAASLHETDTALQEWVRVPYEQYIQKGYALLFNGVDWSRFKENCPPERVMNLINWISEGYMRSFIAIKTAEDRMREFFDYLDLIKTAVYREETL